MVRQMFWFGPPPAQLFERPPEQVFPVLPSPPQLFAPLPADVQALLVCLLQVLEPPSPNPHVFAERPTHEFEPTPEQTLVAAWQLFAAVGVHSLESFALQVFITVQLLNSSGPEQLLLPAVAHVFVVQSAALEVGVRADPAHSTRMDRKATFIAERRLMDRSLARTTASSIGSSLSSDMSVPPKNGLLCVGRVFLPGAQDVERPLSVSDQLIAFGVLVRALGPADAVVVAAELGIVVRPMQGAGVPLGGSFVRNDQVGTSAQVDSDVVDLIAAVLVPSVRHRRQHRDSHRS